jgi:hypothetical protein|tara:strand:- start:92 stop:328 length:237 start_codon:yes stop_codon:yes gene_type:complete
MWQAPFQMPPISEFTCISASFRTFCPWFIRAFFKSFLGARCSFIALGLDRKTLTVNNFSRPEIIFGNQRQGCRTFAEA